MFHSVKKCRQFSDLSAHVSAFQKIQRHNQYGTSDSIGSMTLISATLKVNNFSYICPISVKLSSVKEALLAGPKLLWGWNYPLKTRKKTLLFQINSWKFLAAADHRHHESHDCQNLKFFATFISN